jgi:hypothetical protein
MTYFQFKNYYFCVQDVYYIFSENDELYQFNDSEKYLHFILENGYETAIRLISSKKLIDISKIEEIFEFIRYYFVHNALVKLTDENQIYLNETKNLDKLTYVYNEVERK